MATKTTLNSLPIFFLLGQEAVCVGIKGGLRDFDSVITSYRAHGFAYVMGISVLGVLSELTGKVSGCVRGKVTFCNVVAIGEYLQLFISSMDNYQNALNF